MEIQKTQEKEKVWVPDYIGLGAMKSASSWISACLREHPEVSSEHRKELSFFNLDSNYRKGVSYYESQFSSGVGLMAGEITPTYLHEKIVASRIYTHYPDVKLIVCLRNPADRAWSQYNYGRQMHGRLSLYSSFTEAFMADRSLEEYGRYGEQLEYYLSYFDKSQIRVVFYEDIRQKPIETIQGLYRFIGVGNPSYVPEAATQRVNETGDRTVTVKYGALWRFLLRLRSFLHKFPLAERVLVGSGLISQLKSCLQTSTQKRNKGPTRSPSTMMSFHERKLVIDKLLTDIVKVEKLTGRNLDSWKL